MRSRIGRRERILLRSFTWEIELWKTCKINAILPFGFPTIQSPFSSSSKNKTFLRNSLSLYLSLYHTHAHTHSLTLSQTHFAVISKVYPFRKTCHPKCSLVTSFSSPISPPFKILHQRSNLRVKFWRSMKTLFYKNASRYGLTKRPKLIN